MTSTADSISFRFSALDGDNYRLELRGNRIGELSGVFKAPLDPATWVAVMASLESGSDPFAADPEIRSRLESLGGRKQLPQRVGAALAEALLADDDIRRGFDSAQSNAEADGHILPVELRFGDGSDALASLPWELLYYDNRFLVADTTIALSRYPEGDVPRISALAELPLRLLLLLPEPDGAPPTFPEKARQSLVDGLKELDDAGAIAVEELRPPTYESLVAAVTTQSYHMIVFIGHGVHKEGVGSFLVFEDEAGKWQHISAGVVGNALRNRGVRLVLLGACQSTTITATPTPAGESVVSPSNIWQGTAQTFLHSGVPLAIGMQLVVRVDAALAFIRQFARSLAAGKSVLEATGDGRTLLFLPSYNDAWFIPALYGRPKGDTRLFAPSEEPEQQPVPVTSAPGTPVARSEPAAQNTSPPSTEMSRTELRRFLSKSFSLDELRTLAYDLDVEIDDLGGSGKSGKIINLITYFERRGRYQELVDAAIKMQSEL